MAWVSEKGHAGGWLLLSRVPAPHPSPPAATGSSVLLSCSSSPPVLSQSPDLQLVGLKGTFDALLSALCTKAGPGDFLQDVGGGWGERLIREKEPGVFLQKKYFYVKMIKKTNPNMAIRDHFVRFIFDSDWRRPEMGVARGAPPLGSWILGVCGEEWVLTLTCGFSHRY